MSCLPPPAPALSTARQCSQRFGTRRRLSRGGRLISRIATGTGDKGETGLFDGSRARKTHPIVRAFGDVDELDAAIGLAVSPADRGATRRTPQERRREPFPPN